MSLSNWRVMSLSNRRVVSLSNWPISVGIYAISTLIGIVAFLYPFFTTIEQGGGPMARQQEGYLLTIILLTVCLIALFIELQGVAVSAKMVATLGVLIAITSILRFLETAIPGPGGFSPIFVPIILAGYVFGARFGFLMGSLTLLVSALITGGIGPWLPFQMFLGGWIGMGAGWLPHPNTVRWQQLILMAYATVTALVFGFVINLYFWPFVIGDPAQSWSNSLDWQTGLARYLAFYLATSLLWDMVRVVGNVVLIALLGQSLIRIFTRFKRRFHFELA